MNVSLAIITLVILSLTIIFQIRIWRVRVLLSPGFYFSIIWILGVIGLLLFKSIGILLEKHPEYIDELNILISYTACCFILVSRIGRKKVNVKPIFLNFFPSLFLFRVLSLSFFVLSIFVFIYEGSGFDFSHARNSMHKTIEARNQLVNYIRLLSVPLSIYSGWALTYLIRISKKHSPTHYIFLVLPFFSEILFSLSEGGRVSMAYSLILYIIGASISLPKNYKIRTNKKIIFITLFTLFGVNLLMSGIGELRIKGDGKSERIRLIKESLGVFSFVHGAVDYVYSSYVGYQFRRLDAVDNNLGYGQYTFNGFINWQFPFLSRFGIHDASIANAFDIFYHNQETYDFKRTYYYTTNSSYIPLIKDYGYSFNLFLVIFIVVYISHYFFIKIQQKKIISNATSFFLFYIFFIYWAKSNFYGELSNSILIPLYSFLLVDILKIFIKRKNKI